MYVIDVEYKREAKREREKKTEKDIDRGIVYGKYKLEDMEKETV